MKDIQLIMLQEEPEKVLEQLRYDDVYRVLDGLEEVAILLSSRSYMVLLDQLVRGGLIKTNEDKE